MELFFGEENDEVENEENSIIVYQSGNKL